MKRYILFVMAIFSLWLLPGISPAEAHKLMVFAYLEGKTLTGQAYFSGGKAGQNVPVRVTCGENLLGEGTTDKKGNFSFSLLEIPDQDIVIVADAGLGHRAVRILQTHHSTEHDTEKIPLSEAEIFVSSETVRQIVRQEVAPLKDMLLSLERKEGRPGMVQIFGGLGYIFGFVGFYLWLRKGRPHG